jgi:hypothetical protein
MNTTIEANVKFILVDLYEGIMEFYGNFSFCVCSTDQHFIDRETEKQLRETDRHTDRRITFKPPKIRPCFKRRIK